MTILSLLFTVLVPIYAVFSVPEDQRAPLETELLRSYFRPEISQFVEYGLGVWEVSYAHLALMRYSWSSYRLWCAFR